MDLTLLAPILIFSGGLITILFWVPKVLNRSQVKEFLGRRYPLIYLVYFINGPFLLMVGLYILWFQRG